MMKKIWMYMAVVCAVCVSSCNEQKPCTEVNWATFNIRYANPNDGLDFWENRKDTVASFILANDLDVVGMQEVLHSQMEDLKARLPEYEAVGVGRDDGKQRGIRVSERQHNQNRKCKHTCWQHIVRKTCWQHIYRNNCWQHIYRNNC